MKTCITLISSLLFFLFFLVEITLVYSDSPSSSLQDKCSPELGKLGECLSYASAKADTPTSACCGSVTEIRQKDAVCLCFIIQQAHAGGSSVTSVRLQLDRLIKLPTACKLANSSVSDCPKLLNILPSSPDYAIFTNATKATTIPAGPSGSSSSGSSNSSNNSAGIMNKVHFASISIVTMISTLYFAIFQVEA